MIGKSQPQRHRRRSKKAAPLRTRVVQALLALILMATPIGIYLYQHRPNLYDSTRTDLLEASRELDIYYHDMDSLMQEDRHGVEALKASINWLQQAAASDPDNLAEINTITSELEHWEQLARSGTMSSGELHDRYRSLAARVEQMIKTRTEAAQTKEDLKTQ